MTNEFNIPPLLRTRLAPTPSGLLHVGNGLSFIMTWAIARAAGGRLLLRIDDLDKVRCRDAYLEDIFYTLDWLGIDYDEGPANVSDFQRNWSQHLRLDLYTEVLMRLRDAGLLFACNCSRKSIRENAVDGRYMDTCRDKNLPFTATDTAWRVIAPDAENTIKLRTWSVAASEILLTELDAFVVKQKDGFPAYQLASLVDDTHFKLNFIVRGQDLYASTLSQLYLAQLLAINTFQNTIFWHHPLVLDSDGNKLSKSKGAAALQAWREAGQSPAALFEQSSRQLGLLESYSNGTDLVEALRAIFKN